MIRAKGQRITDYTPREISILAEQFLLARPETFVVKARDVIAEQIRTEQGAERCPGATQSLREPSYR